MQLEIKYSVKSLWYSNRPYALIVVTKEQKKAKALSIPQEDLLQHTHAVSPSLYPQDLISLSFLNSSSMLVLHYPSTVSYIAWYLLVQNILFSLFKLTTS